MRIRKGKNGIIALVAEPVKAFINKFPKGVARNKRTFLMVEQAAVGAFNGGT